MQPLYVPVGATIFRTGDASLAVYVIESGEVAITVNDGVEVVRLHPGELFGESGVLECRSRAATATAVIETTLLVTPADIFLHAFGMENDRALALVKLLCSTTRRAAHAGKPALPG
jgi:CRP-like cAMP-binding protein